MIEAKPPSRNELVSLLVLALGVGLAVWEGSDSRAGATGVALCVAATLSDGFVAAASGRLLTSGKHTRCAMSAHLGNATHVALLVYAVHCVTGAIVCLFHVVYIRQHILRHNGRRAASVDVRACDAGGATALLCLERGKSAGQIESAGVRRANSARRCACASLLTSIAVFINCLAVKCSCNLYRVKRLVKSKIALMFIPVRLF